MLNLNKFVFNSFYENTYIIWDEDTFEAAVIDPDCSDEMEEQELSNFIESKKLNVKYLILTHAHIDHVLGCKFVLDKYKPQFIAPGKDEVLLNNIHLQGNMFNMEIPQFGHPDILVNEDQEFKIGNSTIKFLLTPGHTQGEICIYMEQEKMCITGDVLFNEGVGRTDLMGGDYQQLMKSITEKLLTLPEDVVIYPGHGEESTIAHERKFNPFVKNFY